MQFESRDFVRRETALPLGPLRWLRARDPPSLQFNHRGGGGGNTHTPPMSCAIAT